MKKLSSRRLFTIIDHNFKESKHQSNYTSYNSSGRRQDNGSEISISEFRCRPETSRLYKYIAEIVNNTHYLAEENVLQHKRRHITLV